MGGKSKNIDWVDRFEKVKKEMQTGSALYNACRKLKFSKVQLLDNISLEQKQELEKIKVSNSGGFTQNIKWNWVIEQEDE